MTQVKNRYDRATNSKATNKKGQFLFGIRFKTTSAYTETFVFLLWYIFSPTFLVPSIAFFFRLKSLYKIILKPKLLYKVMCKPNLEHTIAEIYF